MSDSGSISNDVTGLIGTKHQCAKCGFCSTSITDRMCAECRKGDVMDQWYRKVEPKQKVDPVIGVTHDGIDVYASTGVVLKPTVLCIGKASDGCLHAAIEFNKDQQGKRWPYLVIQIGEKVFQSGWLFS